MFYEKREIEDNVSNEKLDYFLVNNPKLGRFYLLPKIHERLYDIPRRPIILILNITLKIYQLFLNIILRRSQKKLNHILRTSMIFT